MLQRVKAVKDESSHWYVIPEELFNNFILLSQQATGNDDAADEFEYKFSTYRTGGDLNNIQLYTEI